VTPDHDVHARLPGPLVDAVLSKAPGLSLVGVIKYALALFAGWDQSAAESIARPRRSGEAEAEQGAGAVAGWDQSAAESAAESIARPRRSGGSE
jgi:hypothetical protein